MKENMKKIGKIAFKIGTEKAIDVTTSTTKNIINGFLWKIAIIGVLSLTLVLTTCVGFSYLVGS